jgi:hypothetical protein
MRYLIQLRCALFIPFTAILGILMDLIACDNDNNTSADTEAESIVEVTAIHDHSKNLHLFEMDRYDISTGWTTFNFTNASPVDHFLVIFHVPDEAINAAETAGESLLEHWFQAVTEPFQYEFNPYHHGEIDYGEFVDNLVGSITERGPWFFDPGAAPMGGPGFTAPGNTTETAVYLEPGQYIVECYVKDEDGLFHSYMGMLELLTVTDEEAGTKSPEPSATVSVSTFGGIQQDGDLGSGRQIVQVLFEDQDAYTHLLGHNVQLVRFDEQPDNQLLDELANWMDWTQPMGLVDRSPDGTEFVGGTMEMTEGASAYLSVVLEPGHYAWIAEIPDPASHEMLQTFIVE